MKNLTTMVDLHVRSATLHEHVKCMTMLGEREFYLSPAVLWFAREMEKKITKHKERGDSFKEASQNDLYWMMRDELKELVNEIDADEHEKVIQEAADVANYAMFIAINAEEKRGEKT